MDCFPPCQVCNDLCKRVHPDRLSRDDAPRLQTKPVRKVGVSRAAKSAIAEKASAGYLFLSCGCITTYDEQTIITFLVMKPGMKKPKGKFWCEKHGNWQVKKKSEKIIYPEEPPF